MNVSCSGFSFFFRYVYFTDDFIVSLVKVSCARFFCLLTYSGSVPTHVFQRFCDAFLLLFLLFTGNMIKQLISEVTVCLFSFSSLQTMCKLKKKKKIIYVLSIIVGQKFSGKVFFFS